MSVSNKKGVTREGGVSVQVSVSLYAGDLAGLDFVCCEAQWSRSNAIRALIRAELERRGMIGLPSGEVLSVAELERRAAVERDATTDATTDEGEF